MLSRFSCSTPLFSCLTPPLSCLLKNKRLYSHRTLSLTPSFHHHALDLLKNTRPWARPSLAFSLMALSLLCRKYPLFYDTTILRIIQISQKLWQYSKTEYTILYHFKLHLYPSFNIKVNIFAKISKLFEQI